jgi:hypothetical protein
MNVSQMLAHCNVSYELVYDSKHAKPNLLMKFIMKAFVKNIIVSEEPFKRNSQTAPSFVVTDEKKLRKKKIA